MKRFSLKGVGSPKLWLKEASQEIQEIYDRNNSLNTFNLEIRPNGIIMYFTVKLEVYAVVIPFFQMSLYKVEGNQFVLYGDGHRVKFENKGRSTEDFIRKVLNIRAAYLKNYELV